jgi:hypothetical protein
MLSDTDAVLWTFTEAVFKQEEWNHRCAEARH